MVRVNKYTIKREKADGAIKNGQSRKTEKIGYIRHRTKTVKTHNTENSKDEHQGPTKNPEHQGSTKNRELTRVFANDVL